MWRMDICKSGKFYLEIHNNNVGTLMDETGVTTFVEGLTVEDLDELMGVLKPYWMEGNLQKMLRGKS